VTLLLRVAAAALATLALLAVGLVGARRCLRLLDGEGGRHDRAGHLVGTGGNLTFIRGLDQPQAIAVDGAHERPAAVDAGQGAPDDGAKPARAELPAGAGPAPTGRQPRIAAR
jgi:hypothetical protein